VKATDHAGIHSDEFLLEMKKTVKRVQQLLRDPERTAFVVVTIPEGMAVAETEDLIKDLKRNKVPSRHIIINNVVPKEKSPFLQKRRSTQERYIRQYKKSFPGFNIIEIELWAEDIVGVEKLTALDNHLFR